MEFEKVIHGKTLVYYVRFEPKRHTYVSHEPIGNEDNDAFQHACGLFDRRYTCWNNRFNGFNPYCDSNVPDYTPELN